MINTKLIGTVLLSILSKPAQLHALYIIAYHKRKQEFITKKKNNKKWKKVDIIQYVKYCSLLMQRCNNVV